MKEYSSYKPFDGKLVDRIPSHWNESIIKRVTQIMYGDSLSQSNRIDGDVPVYGSNGIVGYHNESITESPCIIIGRKGSFGKVAYSDIRCFPIDTTFFIDKTLTKNNLRWIFYLLHSLKLDAYSKDSAVPGLSREDTYYRKTPIPSISEQQAIADYLDYKTSQIDTLIKKKQRQIELLQEYRIALINQAVTKGLDPNVTMKDSGYECLGEIPEHWETKRVKHIVKRHKNAIKTGPFGSQLKNSDMSKSAVKVYNQRSVIDKDFSSGNKFVTIEKYHKLKDFEIFPGDILLTTRGTIGKCAIFPDDAEKGILHPCLIRIQVDEDIILREYIIWYIEDSAMFQESVTFESNATTIDVIYSETLKEVVVPIPPLREQKEIIEYLKIQNKNISKACIKLEKQVSLLNEYRNTIISNTVTGKIDVRDWKGL